MKFLIYAPQACNAMHHEALLEMALELKAEAHEVHILQCRGEIPLCDINGTHYLHVCQGCRAWSKRTWDTVGIPRSHRHSLGFKQIDISIPKFKNLGELVEYRWKNLPIGEAIGLSLLTGITRDTNPPMERYRPFIEKAFCSYASLFEETLELLKSLKPDKFVVFHGSNTTNGPGFRAARQLKIDTLVLERDSEHRYTVHENYDILAVEEFSKKIFSAGLKMQQDPQAAEKAQQWFHGNRGGNKSTFWNFLVDQKAGSLPKNFDRSKKNIAIFLSSEDEFFVRPSLRIPFFETQGRVLEYLLQSLEDPQIHLYVRAHPNLKGIDCEQNRHLAKLKGKNFTLIPPEDSIDTYALLEACEKVLTFGSTVGIEATFWGKPSILLGVIGYQALDACYIPRDPKHLLELLQSELPPKPKESALAYGYYQVTKGFPFKHVSSYYSGGKTKIEGQEIDLTSFDSFTVWLKSWKDRIERLIDRNWLRLINLRGTYERNI